MGAYSPGCRVSGCLVLSGLLVPENKNDKPLLFLKCINITSVNCESFSDTFGFANKAPGFAVVLSFHKASSN